MRKALYNFAFLFVFLTPSLLAQTNVIKKYEYWIGQQYEQRVSEITNGHVSEELDVSGLPRGVHTFTFRACDERGRWSSPMVRYFLRERSLEGNTPMEYEYWMDNGYAVRKKGSFDGDQMTFDVDMSVLPVGMHMLQFRLRDAAGQWSEPLTRIFLRAESPFSNSVTDYEYWIDERIDKSQKGIMANGSIDLELDLSDLGKGVHTLSYRFREGTGRWSRPEARSFIVSELPFENNEIVSYEYWFNQGRTIHVDIDHPSNPLKMENVWVEVKEVIPNEIPFDYRLDLSTRTVWCKDSVQFGIRCIDMRDKSTEAVMSDKFFMELPVSLDFMNLQNGEPTLFTPPEAGEIRAFAMETEIGDTLYWQTNGSSMIDFYTDNGVKIAVVPTDNESGGKNYTTMSGTTTYALLHHATAGVMKELSLTCTRRSLSDISQIKTRNCLMIDRQQLVFISEESGNLSVIDIAGRVIIQKKVDIGTTHIVLQPGVYLVGFNEKIIDKVNVH